MPAVADLLLSSCCQMRSAPEGKCFQFVLNCAQMVIAHVVGPVVHRVPEACPWVDYYRYIYAMMCPRFHQRRLLAAINSGTLLINDYTETSLSESGW